MIDGVSATENLRFLLHHRRTVQVLVGDAVVVAIPNGHHANASLGLGGIGSGHTTWSIHLHALLGDSECKFSPVYTIFGCERSA